MPDGVDGLYIRRRSLVELRLLDGPNLYFPRPAAKLTLARSGGVTRWQCVSDWTVCERDRHGISLAQLRPGGGVGVRPGAGAGHRGHRRKELTEMITAEVASTASWSSRVTSLAPAEPAKYCFTPGVELAVTETARGGILRRGVGVAYSAVSVVTNISADHLGLEELAPSISWPRSSSDHQDHQATRLVRAECRRSADVRYAAWHQSSDLCLHS